ncbi:hypothetical protein LAWI1_G002839 [Lachnellula willkommii]|uniref:Uncharacterized protein n=1 Tax=Lachnellula willkommii TaxID=215461 RepID=A0A559MDS0_9HELO|nr:hypothetical protein LAWI1_G002839 [Lachnellula willkommii]
MATASELEKIGNNPIKDREESNRYTIKLISKYSRNLLGKSTIMLEASISDTLRRRPSQIRWGISAEN